MELPKIKHGIPVALSDLAPSSPLRADGQSLRVTGKLQTFLVETAIAVIVDGSDNLKIDTQFLGDLSLRVGSMYLFIGELRVFSDSEVMLQARVGRNVDGMDLSLYYQSLGLLRKFVSNRATTS